MASLIGAGFEQRLVNKLVKQVLAGNNLELKCGRQKFGFLDVRDAASGIISAAYGDSFKEVYNLGADLSYSLEEIARCVQATVEEEGLKRTDISLTETDDVLNSELDSSLFKEQFGWKPVYSLKDTVRSIIRAALS
jgi:nucleoside-diphosphate-sugar epimerase